MLESCDGDLKRRFDVWDWVDEPWRLLQTAQCQFGRCDQKHTDILMNRHVDASVARLHETAVRADAQPARATDDPSSVSPPRRVRRRMPRCARSDSRTSTSHA